MDLRFTPEQEQFREELTRWIGTNLERTWTEEVKDPNHDANSLVEVRRRWQSKLNDAGYLGMQWPTEWGGRGASEVEGAILLEKLSRADAPQIPNFLGVALLGPALIHHGTVEQR